MTSSPWKYFFLHNLGRSLMWNWSCNEYFRNFQNHEIVELGRTFFVGSVTGSWTHYQKSQEHALHFELLIDVLAQILGKLWQFKTSTYFLTWWRHLWRHQRQNVHSSFRKQVPYLCQVWCWLLKRCGLYRVDNTQTDRQTDRHTNRQTNILAKIENFGK